MDISDNKVLKWALILGIIIVLNLFFAYTMKVVYNSPEYTNFCQDTQVIKKVDNELTCTEQGGQWNENVYRDPVGKVETTFDENGNVINPGYCDLYYTCNQEYQDAQKGYEKNVFMTLIALGVISILIGFFFATQAVVSVAFSLGGVLTFVWASIRYWQFASEYLQVGILGLALAILIYLGIRKFK